MSESHAAQRANRFAGPAANCLALCAALTLVSGCSTLAHDRGSDEDAEANQALSGEQQAVAPVQAIDAPRAQLIARDFTDAMVQLPGLAPGQTSLRVVAPNTLFAEQIIGALRGAGYDMRLVSARVDGVLDFEVSVDEFSADDSDTYTFVVSAETVQLKRSYKVDPAGVQPATPMLVRGASSDGIVMDASRFDEAAVQRAISAERTALADAAESDEGGAQVRTAVEPTVDSRVRTQAESSGDVPNFSETGQSRYAQLLSNYEVVDRYTMVFSNDSMVMGRNNKRTAQQIIEGYKPESDLISVIGCSHGRTALANGNAVLALGRAERVKEEFIQSGIDPDQVLDEGCWADSYHEQMPRRGVVVTHQRRVLQPSAPDLGTD